MRKRRRGYRKYKFTEKTLSKRGITALVLALLSLVSFVVMVVLAFRSAGNLSIYIACYGILAFFAALAAVILAILLYHSFCVYANVFVNLSQIFLWEMALK